MLINIVVWCIRTWIKAILFIDRKLDEIGA